MDNISPEVTDDQSVTSPSKEALGRNSYVRRSERKNNIHINMTQGLGPQENLIVTILRV